jgi:hypothetical protein
MDPGVHSLQYMDAIEGKDQGYRINFYHSLRDVLNLIPKVRSLTDSLVTSTSDVNLLDLILRRDFSIWRHCQMYSYKTEFCTNDERQERFLL